MSDHYGGGDTGGGCDSGGYSNDYSCDYTSSSAHHSSSGHTGNDYSAIGSTFSALGSAIEAVNSVESAKSASEHHYHHTNHTSNDHHSSTRLQIDDVPTHDKYTGTNQSIWDDRSTDYVSSAGNKREYKSYIRRGSYSNYNSSPSTSNECCSKFDYNMRKPKYIWLAIFIVIFVILYLYLIFAHIIPAHAEISALNKQMQDELTTRSPLLHYNNHRTTHWYDLKSSSK